MSALLFFSGPAMSVTSPPLAAGGVESEVHRIRALLKQRHFAEAVDAAAALRGAYPENRDVLYLLALGLRHAHRTADALATLQELERHHRSEERRVGKECRSRWSAYDYNNTENE